MENFNFEMVWNKFEGMLIKEMLVLVLEEYDFVIFDCVFGYNLLICSGIVVSDFYLLLVCFEFLLVVGM